MLYHLVAFLTIVVWGSTFVFTKMLLQAGLSAAQIFTLRFLIAYVLLMSSQLLMGRISRSSLFCKNWRDELLMVALGLVGGSLYFLTENEALNYTTATNTSLIVCSCPLVASVLIGLFYRSERMSRLQTFGALMAVAGVATVVLNEDDYLLQEILFNPYTHDQVSQIRTELKELLEIIDTKNAEGMKAYLTKIRNNVKRDIEIKKQ